MDEARFKYKCRNCGIIFDGACCGEEIAKALLMGVLLDNKSILDQFGMVPYLLTMHLCNSAGDCGVADLIGYEMARVNEG